MNGPRRSIAHRRNRNTAELPECATPGCGLPANGSCGFCGACYQWNRVGIHFSRQHRDHYLWQRRRLVTRAEVLANLRVHVTATTKVSDIFSSGTMRTTTAARRSTRRKR